MKKQVSRIIGEEVIIVNVHNDGTGKDNRYWSVTYDRGESRRGKIRDGDKIEHNGKQYAFVSGGCNPELILKYFPKLKPFIDLHLSSLDGIPMYLIENGEYFVKKNEPQFVASHFRISQEQADNLIATYRSKAVKYNKDVAHTYLANFANDQLERYASEAKEACSLLESL